MFAPSVIATREAFFHDNLKADIPGGRILRRDTATCWGFRDQLADAVDDKGNPTRSLTTEEDAFITHERLLSTLDFRYWAERWAYVAKETQDTEPIFPLWTSQELLLARIGEIEAVRHAEGSPDGILINCLKARQLGASTIVEVILAHGVTTQRGLRGLVAGDVQEQSQYMFGMAETVITNLPWWLKPPLQAHQRGLRWAATTGSSLQAAWGKSARGGLADREKAKGNLGRGRTYSRVHLSELSSWERPEQINDALLPGVPIRPRVFGAFESTAKGRYDWWHEHWLATEKGLRVSGRRFDNVFIPWYIEPDKYWLPAPAGWAPAATTLAHSAAVEIDSPKWCLGRTIRLSREQLYWYESTRAAYDSADELYKFFEEFCSTPTEAFQHAGRSIFSAKTLERCKSYERPPILVRVRPAKDIAQLKQWEKKPTEEGALTE